MREVRELGLHPLENTRTELPGFDLAGVNDLTGDTFDQGPDYAKALADLFTEHTVTAWDTDLRAELERLTHPGS